MFFFFLDKKWCVNTVIKVIVKHICPVVLSHLGVSECRAVGLHQIWLDCAVAWWGEASCGRGGTISGDTNQDAAPWGASVCELFLSRRERETGGSQGSWTSHHGRTRMQRAPSG